MNTQYRYLVLHDEHYAFFWSSEDTPLGAQSEEWLRIKSLEHLQAALREIEEHMLPHENILFNLIVDQPSAAIFSELLRAGIPFFAHQWQIMRWETLTQGQTGEFDYPRPSLAAVSMILPLGVIAEPLVQKTKRASRPAAELDLQPPTEPLSSEQLVSFLPALYLHAFTVLSGVDLAILTGRIEPYVLPSPYPELSRNALQRKQQAFMALPRAQQRQVLVFVQTVGKELSPRAEMRDYLRGLEV